MSVFLRLQGGLTDSRIEAVATNQNGDIIAVDQLTLERAMELHEQLNEMINTVSQERQKQIQQELTRLQMEMEKLKRAAKVEEPKAAETKAAPTRSEMNDGGSLRIVPRYRDNDEGEMVL